MNGLISENIFQLNFLVLQYLQDFAENLTYPMFLIVLNWIKLQKVHPISEAFSTTWRLDHQMSPQVWQLVMAPLGRGQSFSNEVNTLWFIIFMQFETITYVKEKPQMNLHTTILCFKDRMGYVFSKIMYCNISLIIAYCIPTWRTSKMFSEWLTLHHIYTYLYNIFLSQWFCHEVGKSHRWAKNSQLSIW